MSWQLDEVLRTQYGTWVGQDSSAGSDRGGFQDELKSPVTSDSLSRLQIQGIGLGKSGVRASSRLQNIRSSKAGAGHAALRLAALLLIAVVLTGCGTLQESSGAAHPKDPFEQWNRNVFALNDKLDAALLKPASQAYVKVVPEQGRSAVENFFGNLTDAWSAVNWVLQGQFRKGVQQGARVAWNTTLGLAGLLDVSSSLGLPKGSQDFGQTLGAWGVGTGPYLVLPLLGPSTLRDGLALPVDRLSRAPVGRAGRGTELASASLELLSVRASLLGAGEILNGISLDKYTFLRDAYLQRRSQVGSPDDEDEFEVVESGAPRPKLTE